MADREDRRPGIGLAADDASRVARQFGVSHQQVERDHAISHVLAFLASLPESKHLTFFGGTALARTDLPDLRLSEDIDLLVTGRRQTVAQAIESRLARHLARTFVSVTWIAPLTTATGATPAIIELDGTSRVQIQLLAADDYPPWPTAMRHLEQRYTDAPTAAMRTLTAESFVAAKTAAWIDRRAARDLYDLWALAESGRFTTAAAELYRSHGPTGRPPGSWAFDDVPSNAEWQAALSHQCRLVVTPAEAAEAVRSAWEALA